MISVRARIYGTVDWLGHRLVLSLSERAVINGLPVYANEHNLSDFADLWFEKTRRALDLIERTAPVMAARLRRDVRMIIVDEMQGPDYVRRMRAIRLHGPTIINHDTANVACTVIHEATHARIAARGIQYTREQRGRHEHACTLAEVRFARKLPDGHVLAASLLKNLDTPWWTDEALHRRKLEEFDRLKLTGPIGRYIRRKMESRNPRSNQGGRTAS